MAYAEVLQVVNGELVAKQVDKRILEHASVTVSTITVNIVISGICRRLRRQWGIADRQSTIKSRKAMNANSNAGGAGRKHQVPQRELPRGNASQFSREPQLAICGLSAAVRGKSVGYAQVRTREQSDRG